MQLAVSSKNECITEVCLHLAVVAVKFIINKNCFALNKQHSDFIYIADCNIQSEY